MERTRPPLIGVLTPFTGGFYYGAAMAGIQRVAATHGASVVALQTTGMDLAASDAPDDQFLGLSAVDGWLAVNQFDAPTFAARIRARGIPLVHVNSRPETPGGCSVLPDNHTTMRAAVRHLIEHGHRRIAFAGFLGQADLRERYDGYVTALVEAGIYADPALLFESPANFELEGEELGARLLAAGLPCTAVVAGTDRLALGILTTLRQAGVRVPDRLALIGFDDIERAQLVDPPLTTVRQNFGLVTGTATRTLLEHLLKGAPLPPIVRVPTTFVPRQSCGCRVSYEAPVPSPPDPEISAETALSHALRRVAAAGRVSDGRETWPGASTIAELLGAVRRGESNLDDHDLNALFGEFLQGNRDADSIDEVLTVLESTVRAWPSDAAGERALGSALRQLRVALIRNWRRLEIERNRYYESVAEANAKVNHALALWRPHDGMDPSWLRFTHAGYACLGLWSKSPAGAPRTLHVVGEYCGDGEASGIRGSLHLPSHFPPPGVAERVRGERNVLTVVPVKSGHRDLGVLAIAAPIEVELLDRVGNASDWAAQVGAALERADVDQQLRRHAFYDALTGLPNRAFLLERLEALALERHEHSLAVLFLDIDDFKKINDSKGHVAGDQLLLEIAARLGRVVGDGMVARLGGDEFAVAMLDTPNHHDVLVQVAAIQAALGAPFVIDDDVVFTSCSIGVAFSSAESPSAAALLRDADTAMYRAKLQGRGRHEVFHHGMHAQAVERLRLDSRLRQALERGEFALVYQPIVAVASGRPLGAEALIRWNHPDQGLVSPARFLAVAEEVGLSIPIGRWVLETACREAKSFQREGDDALVYVSVNVAAEHLQSPGFIEFVERLLVETGLPPAALGLELVERSLATERDLTARVLGRLLDLGVRVAIDDFGTGYSSLSYLKNFPVSVLKIDRSFVQGLSSDSRDAAIVHATVTMAHGLGLSVVAEGVETAEQLHVLELQGCDAVQGYLLSHPLHPEGCRRFLHADRSTRVPRPGVADGAGSPALRRVK
ncbi:MAG TPA: EAL domain-containing protein [Polyangiaceae bacterium]|jgi:diguanylate cyclase (GGDEF)-like protein|nr:EAL domain-containing protein [Polyangiaceae bacterium]